MLCCVACAGGKYMEYFFILVQAVQQNMSQQGVLQHPQHPLTSILGSRKFMSHKRM